MPKIAHVFLLGRPANTQNLRLWPAAVTWFFPSIKLSSPVWVIFSVTFFSWPEPAAFHEKIFFLLL
jgi:hypothetical protein